MTDWLAAISKIKTIITGRPIPADQPRNVAMNDIQTSPATLTTEAKYIPLYLQPLEQRFKETNFDDLAPVCEWIGIPRPEEMPTPGQARTWHREEWAKWALEHGFAFDDEATHSWMWRNKVVSTLVLSVAKTPSDFRTPMAMATESRRAVREFATGLNAVMRRAIEKGLNNPEWRAMSEDEFRVRMVNTIQSKDTTFRDAIMNMQQTGMENGKLSKTVSDLVNILQRINKDFGISPAKTLGLLLQDPKLGQDEWERMKLFAPEHPIGASMFYEAKDYLEELREVDRAEREEKRLEREREDAEREEKRLAKLRPKTSRQVLQEMIDRETDTRLNSIKGCIGAAISTVDRLRAMEAQLAKSLDVPEIDDPAMKAEIAAKDKQIEVQSIRLENLIATIGEKDSQIQDLKAQAAQVSAERLGRLNNIEEQMHALASLVISTIDDAKKGNSFQMVEALNNLVAEAKNFLPQEQLVASN